VGLEGEECLGKLWGGLAWGSVGHGNIYIANDIDICQERNVSCRMLGLGALLSKSGSRAPALRRRKFGYNAPASIGDL